jgi:four helix bundle protein
MADRGYQDLIAWQKGMALVKETYSLTSSWPAEERFGLTLQARRAAVSVPANIAEGSGRTGVRNLRYHLSIAHGSLCELETHVLLAQELGFTGVTDTDALIQSQRRGGTNYPRPTQESSERLRKNYLFRTYRLADLPTYRLHNRRSTQ